MNTVVALAIAVCKMLLVVLLLCTCDSVVAAPPIKPGTRLLRDWRGQSHRVTVLENGYEYAGKRYESLSQIARLITGTRWSGPLFFGLKGNHARDRTHEQRS